MQYMPPFKSFSVSSLDMSIPIGVEVGSKCAIIYIYLSPRDNNGGLVFLLVPDGILKNPALKKGFIR